MFRSLLLLAVIFVLTVTAEPEDDMAARPKRAPILGLLIKGLLHGGHHHGHGHHHHHHGSVFI